MVVIAQDARSSIRIKFAVLVAIQQREGPAKHNNSITNGKDDQGSVSASDGKYTQSLFGQQRCKHQHLKKQWARHGIMLPLHTTYFHKLIFKQNVHESWHRQCWHIGCKH
jgi:hypothetical protein